MGAMLLGVLLGAVSGLSCLMFGGGLFWSLVVYAVCSSASTLGIGLFFWLSEEVLYSSPMSPVRPGRGAYPSARTYRKRERCLR